MTFLDICAGIGGFRTGLERAGMKCVGFVEIDKFARKSYIAMHDADKEWSAYDVGDVNAEEMPRADLWCFGFPCQDISVAGKRRGLDGERSGIFYKIIELIKSQSPENKPEWILIENVKNLLSVNGGRDFTEVLYQISESGYDAEYQVYNSKDYGVPQNRERVFIVGHLRSRGRRNVLSESGAGGQTANESKINMLFDSYHQQDRIYGTDGISRVITSAEGGGMGGGLRTGLYAIPKINSFVIGRTYQNYVQSYDGLSRTVTARDYKDPQKIAIPKINKVIDSTQHFSVVDSEGINPTISACDYKDPQKIAVPKLKQIVEGPQANRIYESEGLSKTLVGEAGGGGAKTGYYAVPCLTPDREKRQQGRRFKTNGEPMFTLTARDRHGVLLHDGKEFYVRKLTPKECFRLQGFTDEQFERAEKVNSNTQLYKQAGNAVTVNVAEHIGRLVMECADE